MQQTHPVSVPRKALSDFSVDRLTGDAGVNPTFAPPWCFGGQNLAAHPLMLYTNYLQQLYALADFQNNIRNAFSAQFQTPDKNASPPHVETPLKLTPPPTPGTPDSASPSNPDAVKRSIESVLAQKPATFQNGITVGYTMDALFVSDGRSKGRLAKQNQRYTCGQCGKSYATSSNLSRHKQTHRPLDSVHAKACHECGKAYVSMPALSMHLLTHKREHVCKECGKSFSRPWLLQGHMRSHTGHKPFGCAHCGKAFADRSNLRAHMQTHSGQKRYTCERCGKAFALKSYLNKHAESACPRSSLDTIHSHGPDSMDGSSPEDHRLRMASGSSLGNASVDESNPVDFGLQIRADCSFGSGSTHSSSPEDLRVNVEV